MRHFDLVVIGSGPGGQKAAIQAAKLGKSVCVVERMQFVGGVAINTGTIPSKALREAVLEVIGAKRQGLASFLARDRRAQLSELTAACQRVIRAEIEIVRNQFAANGIELIQGTGAFATPDVVVVEGRHSVETVGAGHVLIAVGTSPSRPANIAFDNDKIVTSDELLQLPSLPASMMVVGGGVIGTEYASMLAALGVRVTIIEGRPRLMEFLDPEIGEALQYHLRTAGMTLRIGEKVVSIKRISPSPESPTGSADAVEAMLESGKTLRAECLLYCVGRQGATDRLDLQNAGLKADDRGRVKVDKNYKTETAPGAHGGSIYAVGDVIGFPALASTSMEQGRLAACHMFGQHAESPAELFPYGIYSIPEISMVGWTEDKLTAANIPYEAGVAHYKETARGQLIDDQIGMLKLLIHQESHVILGVHIIGTSSTELVHIGQAFMRYKGTAEDIVNTVFNYPTLAECYKVAAFNAINKLRQL